MIGKIFKYNSCDVYYKINLSFTNTNNTYRGIIIKSNRSNFIVGCEYLVYPNLSTELTEGQFNKIMVFE